MAIGEREILRIRKGKCGYLLLRGAEHFHLIRENATLNEARIEKIKRIYPCDSCRLKELGLHVSAFRVGSLRHVVVTGDGLELRIEGENNRRIL